MFDTFDWDPWLTLEKDQDFTLQIPATTKYLTNFLLRLNRPNNKIHSIITLSKHTHIYVFVILQVHVRDNYVVFKPLLLLFFMFFCWRSKETDMTMKKMKMLEKRWDVWGREYVRGSVFWVDLKGEAQKWGLLLASKARGVGYTNCTTQLMPPASLLLGCVCLMLGTTGVWNWRVRPLHHMSSFLSLRRFS